MKIIDIIKEQIDIESEKKDLQNRLNQYVEKGCAPGQVVPLDSNNSQYSYAIKQESKQTPGNFRYLFDIKKDENTYEKRIAVVNKDGRLEFITQKWFCNIDLNYTEKSDFKSQEKSPQQLNAIKTYTDAGWVDLGRELNPAEIPTFDQIDLKDYYGETFPESYILVKKIDSIDTNKIIEELTSLVNTRKFDDSKTCKRIISTYNVAKQKNAPVNDAVLMNFKNAVNACRQKVTNFNDLNRTKNIINDLLSDTENKRWSLSKPTTKSDETSETQ